MVRDFSGSYSQVAGDPSRLCAVSSQMSMTVGPIAWTRSAAVWTPSPFESRYMYWALAGDAKRSAKGRQATRIERKGRLLMVCAPSGPLADGDGPEWVPLTPAIVSDIQVVLTPVGVRPANFSPGRST